MLLNINTSAIVAFTNTLEKLHKSALPSAIRGALNKAVFDVKTKSMISQTAKTFEKRQPNFFKANSKFENATGFNIKSMQATVGFLSVNLKGNNNFAVKDLEQQEHGGVIKRRSFIPLKPARIGNSKSKMVRAIARLSAIKNIVDARKAFGRNDREKFRKSVYHAGAGGYVLGNRTPRILWRVNSLRRLPGGAFKMTPLYTYQKNRSVNIHGHNFMKAASLESGKKMESFYIQEAQRQIMKFK